MKTVLYAWEAGADLGHASLFLPVAKMLRSAGFDVRLVIPEHVSGIQAVRAMLAENSFNWTTTPGSPFVQAAERPSADHADLLDQMPWFRSASELSFYLRSWQSIFEHERPSLVIGDYAIPALLTARLLCIPTVAWDQGFFIPDWNHPLPRFDDVLRLAGQDEPGRDQPPVAATPAYDSRARVLSVTNQALDVLSLPQLNTFEDLFRADSVVRLNYAETSPFGQTTPSTFFGYPESGQFGIAPKWSNSGAPKVFAYVKPGHPSTQQVLDDLRLEAGLDAVVYLPNCPTHIKQKYASQHVSIESEPLNMMATLTEADVVICHAGVGTTLQTLLAGKPLLLHPMHLEQQLNAARVSDFGAAIAVFEPPAAGQVRQAIEKILSDGAYTAKARSFRHKNPPADIGRICHEIEALVGINEPRAESSAITAHRKSTRQVDFSALSVVFLSYDEPNGDDNWQHLRALVPSAKRVHGITGFDAAHKACAEAASTERFILVDGDNRVDERFFQLNVDVPPHLSHSVWQWCSTNEVTGLTYPFGGVKVWTKTIALSMQTHENCTSSEDRLAVDFCAQSGYQTFAPSYSVNLTNGSPYQAFRAAYREVVKIADHFGMPSFLTNLQRRSRSVHSRRLGVWLSTGADVLNGFWSILGARLALRHLIETGINLTDINRYDWFAALWERTLSDLGSDQPSRDALTTHVGAHGDFIRHHIQKPPVIDMTAEQSRQFKVAMKQRRPSDLTLFTPYYSIEAAI